MPKYDFCIDIEIIKGYVLGALKHIETYSEDLRISDLHKKELLHALELSGEDLTTREAYEYYLKQSL